MNWTIGLTLAVAVVTISTVSPESRQTARSPLAVAFLYDLTNSVVPLSQSVSQDRQLEDVTECVVRQMTPMDTLRFGFITSRLYLSRPYSARELSDFYRRVVKPTVVPPSNRVGPSPLWDAIDKAISLLATGDGRRAVVVMTDGLSTGNARSAVDVVNHAKIARVSVSAVFAGNPFLLWKEWPVHPWEALSEMARDTGGLYVVPKAEEHREIRQTSPVSKKSLNRAIEQIFENIRR